MSARLYDGIGKMCSDWLHKWALSAVSIDHSLQSGTFTSQFTPDPVMLSRVSRESRDTMSVLSQICNTSYQIIQRVSHLWIDFINLCYHLIPVKCYCAVLVCVQMNCWLLYKLIFRHKSFSVCTFYGSLNLLSGAPISTVINWLSRK